MASAEYVRFTAVPLLSLLAAVWTLIRWLKRNAFGRGFLLHGGRRTPEVQRKHACWSVLPNLAPELLHIFRGPILAVISGFLGHLATSYLL